MRLIFIRHGDPDYVHDTLTEKGKREAELLAQRVKNWDVSKFYVSPLGRAQLTAEYSLKLRGDTAETLPWLREFNGIIPTSDGGHRIPWDMYPTEWADKEIYYDRNNWFKSDYMQTGNVEDSLNGCMRVLISFLPTMVISTRTVCSALKSTAMKPLCSSVTSAYQW